MTDVGPTPQREPMDYEKPRDEGNDNESLSPEAVRSASASLLASLNAHPGSSMPTGDKPRRGRPPTAKKSAGSRIQAPATTRPRIGGGLPPANDGKPTAEEKKEKADQYAEKIVTELNDFIMEALIGMGLPSQMLYAPGYTPPAAQASGRFTPIGAKLAVSPLQAKVWGRFGAELEASGAGNRLSGATSGAAALPIWGGLALLMAFQYGKQLNDFRQLVQPWIDAKNGMEPPAPPANDPNLRG